MDIVKLDKVNKKFGDKLIFRDLSFSIPENCIVTVTGPSGCGKSTLLNIIGLLEKPDSGSVFINNKLTTNLSNKATSKIIREEISYIFQNNALIDNLSVYDNLVMALKYVDLSEKQKKKNIIEMLKIIDLSDKIDSYVYELSGGEQQRISIIRSVLKPSSIILADEPTGNLDTVNRDHILELLIYIKNNFNKTIVIVTHDPCVAKIGDYLFEL